MFSTMFFPKNKINNVKNKINKYIQIQEKQEQNTSEYGTNNGSTSGESNFSGRKNIISNNNKTYFKDISTKGMKQVEKDNYEVSKYYKCNLYIFIINYITT